MLAGLEHVYSHYQQNVVDDKTLESMYFMPNLPAEEASSVLAPLGEGAFVIRNSSSQSGQFVLSYWLQGQARHVHIANDADGVHLKKSTTMFLCLSDLVGYYW